MHGPPLFELPWSTGFLCRYTIGGSRGGRGLQPPFFWPLNAFEWGHIVGNPPFFVLGWDPPFFKMAGSAPVYTICHKYKCCLNITDMKKLTEAITSRILGSSNWLIVTCSNLIFRDMLRFVQFRLSPL